MSTLEGILRILHIGLGTCGLAAFWIPLASRKGGRLHRAGGRVFAGCAYGVIASALAITALRVQALWSAGARPWLDPDPFGAPVFLAYLAIATLAAVRHGVAVLGAKRDPSALDRWSHTAIGWAALVASVAIVLFALAYRPSSAAVLYALSFVGAVTGGSILTYVRRPPVTARDWFYAHLGAMLTAGIAFHTAFLVFGANRFVGRLPGAWVVLPWILPTLVGVPAILAVSRRYRRRFGDPPPAVLALLRTPPPHAGRPRA